MAITAALVKELRELSGAGMLDCKNVLVEAEGSIEKAMELLREKGISSAAKKSGRVAAEGLVDAYISEDNKTGVLVEVNSETDFVAKNKDFQAYVAQVALQVANSNSDTVEELLKEKWNADPSITVEDANSQKIAVIGENIKIRRFQKFVKEGNGLLTSYIHNAGTVAVLLELTSDVVNDKVKEAGKNICMQIAAMNPQFVDRSEISSDFIKKETEILTQQALNEGKDAKIVEKMIVGRLNKGLKEICLNDQMYVKDEEGKQTIATYLVAVGKEVGATISIKRFVRFATGEGIEKKEENFADEVSKAMQV